MGNNKEEFTAQSAIMVFWIVAILFVTFAPKEIRKELVDYGIKFIGIIVLLVGAYILYLITIKDKIVARRRKREKNKRED
jgi:NADH:ubiquinone oxidoreductase subunit 3 (subunit A)